MTLQERFLRYVKINTTSDENGQGCPSAACEWELARLLADEMRAMGVSNVRLDAHAYVYGEIPANCEHAPAIGLIAHMDTVDAVPGHAFHPRVVEYQGGDICLNAEKGIVLSEKDFPELSQRRGKHLIVTDGTTVLGADDKAGVAEIMTLCERVLQDGSIRHGKICIGFTPDEEIGSGADLFDVPAFGADFAYTVDGGEINELEYENFNAASAKVMVHGRNIHPGSAKNRMKHAARIAMEFNAMLPVQEKPEYTEGYEGFYHLTAIRGDEENAEAGYILRDHDAYHAACGGFPECPLRRGHGGAGAARFLPQYARGDGAAYGCDRARAGSHPQERPGAALRAHPRRYRRRAAELYGAALPQPWHWRRELPRHL